MAGIYTEARRITPTAASVLITGETGTGKEVLARSIHAESGRSRFVPLDCGALPDELFASEVFGYRRGAFTGATADQPGLLEYARGGTLFLDEVGNATLSAQARLLRVLQERSVRRLGDRQERSLEFRVLSATNADLDQMVEAGGFRQDLLYRLNTFTLHIPPLRSRREEIPEITDTILGKLNCEYDGSKTVAHDAVHALSQYHFPGNVRELEHLLHRAYLRADGQEIGREHFSNLPLDHDDRHVHQQPSQVTDFWRDVALPFRERRMTRDHVQKTIHNGLSFTGGHYRGLVKHWGMPEGDYKRFMDFLRRHNLTVDYRQYRRGSDRL